MSTKCVTLVINQPPFLRNSQASLRADNVSWAKDRDMISINIETMQETMKRTCYIHLPNLKIQFQSQYTSLGYIIIDEITFSYKEPQPRQPKV